MTAKMTRVSVAILFATAFAASAQAEYRCDQAPSFVDQRACEAADKGPDALRRYVESMASIRVNLNINDYVNAATVKAWDERSELAARQDEETLKVASSETR